MKKFAQSLVVIVAGVVVAGLILDEAGKGTLGGIVQAMAGKVTRGYGV